MRRISWVILLLGSVFMRPCTGEDLDSVIDKEIYRFEVDNVTVSEAIAELAIEYKPLNVLITFEEAVSAEKDNLISIKVTNVSLRSIVSKIINNHKTYIWRINGNVINIIPSNKKDDTNYILNEKIHKLAIQDKTREEIVEMILGIINQEYPERYKTKNKKGITVDKLILLRPPYEDFGLLQPSLKKHNMEIKDKTVREILNLIATEENVPWHVMLLEKNEDNIRILAFVDS